VEEHLIYFTIETKIFAYRDDLLEAPFFIILILILKLNKENEEILRAS
jgi:hypothetical protein